MMSINNVKNKGKNSTDKSKKWYYRWPKDTSFADVLQNALNGEEKQNKKPKKAKAWINKNIKNIKNIKKHIINHNKTKENVWTTKNTIDNHSKWLDFSKEDILRTLNFENQREGKIKEIHDDGITLRVWNKNYFVSQKYIQDQKLEDLIVWETVAMDIEGKEIAKIEKNKLNIKNLHRAEFRDGIYEWVISSYDAENGGYIVSIGKIGKEQDEFFLSFSDMITNGNAQIWDVVSLDIKEEETEFIVKEFYLKEWNKFNWKLWSKFLLTSNNYKLIKWWKMKGGLSVKIGHYSGIVFADSLPEWFKAGDSLNLIVKSLKNVVKKWETDNSIDRKRLRFEVINYVSSSFRKK